MVAIVEKVIAGRFLNPGSVGHFSQAEPLTDLLERGLDVRKDSPLLSVGKLSQAEFLNDLLERGLDIRENIPLPLADSALVGGVVVAVVVVTMVAGVIVVNVGYLSQAERFKDLLDWGFEVRNETPFLLVDGGFDNRKALGLVSQAELLDDLLKWGFDVRKDIPLPLADSALVGGMAVAVVVVAMVAGVVVVNVGYLSQAERFKDLLDRGFEVRNKTPFPLA